MNKFLFIASYTSAGSKGLLSAGGSSRRVQITQMVEGVGGRVESFHFAFGEADAYVICRLPDAATAAALSLQVSASGAASVRTVVLLTPEEVDDAVRKNVVYRPPGV